MKYNVIAIPKFRKELKHFAKKFRSLKLEYASLIEQLELTPEMGTPLGNNCYKIRLSRHRLQRGCHGLAFATPVFNNF